MMVIDHIRKVIGRASISLDEDDIVLSIVEKLELTVDEIIDPNWRIRILSLSLITCGLIFESS